VKTFEQNKSRLRVVHVAPGLETGGLERLLVEMARHADSGRFDLHFVSLGTRGSLAGAIEGCGWPVTALEERDGLRPRLVWRLQRLFRTLEADVVHTHDEKPLVYGAPAAWLARVPRIIHTQHHGHLAQITKRQNLLIRWAARLVHCYVCVSQDAAEQAVCNGIARHRQALVHNSIDLQRFAYTGPKADGPVVLVARLHPLKGIDVLLRAAVGMVRAEPDFRLEIAGDGAHRPELERLADELGLRAHVRFLGEMRDVAGLLSRARLFVLPSYSEGVSLTLLEAMAVGLPVVATRVGGNPEVVVPGETGVLVPPGNAEELSQAMLQMWRDAGRGRHLGEAGRRRVEQCFDVRRMVKKYERLYEPGMEVGLKSSAEVCERETQALVCS
jgi:glycosyltransferase involved in cell wall biosynthesis